MGETRKSVTKADKVNMYRALQMDTCMNMANAMGIPYSYDNWKKELLTNSNHETIKKNILKKYNITSFDYDENGWDAELIPVILEKVEATMQVTVGDYDDLSKKIQHHITYIFDDSILDEFECQYAIAKAIMDIAKQREVYDSKELSEILDADIYEFIGKFMFTAYEVMHNQPLDKVKEYRDFIFDILSQLKDLHALYGSYAMMDIADLYICHGNDSDGDKIYQYLLREAVIKDYIFYRYALVYSGYDAEKARTIAKEAMHYVDDKFFFYDAILNILQN